MQTKDATIRVQTLNAQWETLGSSRRRGIQPENLELTANEWGSDKASFQLRRDPGAAWPDITAFTPVEISVGGVLVWSGRVLETPNTDSPDPVINVQCEGWQYHLDDDVFQHPLVHSRLADYKDTRSYPDAALGAAALYAAGQVSNDKGLSLSMPNGSPIASGTLVMATLDLGPYATAKRIVVEWESSNNTPSVGFIARSSNAPTNSGSPNFTDAVSFLLNSGAGTTTPGTFATGYRYVLLFLVSSGGFTPAADLWIKLKRVQVFTETAYESGNASVLKAPVVITDALDKGTLLLSDDRSQIDPAGTAVFNIPDFAPPELRSTREIIEAANAYHDYRTKIDVLRRGVFLPRPTAAEVEIGAWGGSVFDDASANSGAEIYNRTIVQGQGADGLPLAVERTASNLPGVSFAPIASPAPDNPTFATNTATWTASSGTAITRDTGVFNSSPASGRWDRSGGALTPGDTLTETFTGTFTKAVPYTLQLALRAGISNDSVLVARFGTATDYALYGLTANVSPGGFTVISIPWTPAATVASGVVLRLSAVNAGTFWYVDTLALNTAQPTLVDRRGFRRTKILPVTFPLTDAVGQQVGDTYLRAHQVTPLRGTATISGDKAARHVLTGRDEPPERLLLRTGELLRLSHRTDPDTGAHARDGRIAEVKYNHAANEATVAIDSRRNSHEALLERLAVVVGT